MEFNAFCSDYHNNNYETSAFISTYSEPFNDNFTDINFSLYSEPFNINFLPSSLELSEPPSVSPVLPFVLPVELLLTSDDNFTDIEPSLPLEPSFGNSNYQYNLAVGDSFDDWLLVDTFMHQYCLERGFGYQIFRNDKDSNDSTIIRRKSFRCSSSGNYEPRKIMDQKLHRLRGTIKTNCEWHVNFTFPKSAHQIGCTTLKDVHNHEVNPAQISHIIARYRRLNSEMIQDLKFFSDCKIAPITQLEILKKKYPEHVFHKQDVYNAIYKLRQSNRDEKLDSVLFLNVLLEKMTQDPRWKIYIRHSGNECRLSGIFWMSPSQQELYQRFSDVVLNNNTCKTNKYNMYLSVLMVKDNYGRFRNIANALVEDEMASTYTWILQCLMKATDNIAPKAFWTDSEPGLINAASQIFPTTPHFYCLFHICIELFEQHWAFMINEFPECERYMTRALYGNRISWAKAYMPFQFNGGIQSTQSVESFNGIIKRSLNSASTLCDIAETIDKRHQEEFKYCQLTDIKAKYTPIGLPHLSSQFFSSVDAIINLQAETIDDNFIEEVVDEPQITLKAILDGIDTSNIIEVWRIIRIEGISSKENLVALFSDGTHICTCMESITKGIICRHFWRVMLYSSTARFHISIIPIRWYKDEILMKLDDILDNSPVLTALESSTEVNTTSRTVDFTLQSLRQLQGSCHKENAQRIIPQRNRFGVAFSTAKTAINIALETGSDTELVKLLKDFILNNQIVSLQENLINQTTNPYITKIRGAPSKKRIKSAIEISGRSAIHDITSQTNIQQSNDGDIMSRSQRKCGLYRKPGHYQKRCPNGRE
ncbi:unnamed protein product [Rhizophagus irregularis]|nr:unnamed protein product [Rhizophagus irregularis]